MCLLPSMNDPNGPRNRTKSHEALDRHSCGYFRRGLLYIINCASHMGWKRERESKVRWPSSSYSKRPPHPMDGCVTGSLRSALRGRTLQPTGPSDPTRARVSRVAVLTRESPAVSWASRAPALARDPAHPWLPPLGSWRAHPPSLHQHLQIALPLRGVVQWSTSERSSRRARTSSACA